MKKVSPKPLPEARYAGHFRCGGVEWPAPAWRGERAQRFRQGPEARQRLSDMKTRHALILVGLASALTLANAVKPLTVDDCSYYYYARQIARDPLDPYGFVFMGFKPAGHTLAPLVLPYWLAGPVALAGERPFLWKLALWPFVLLLVFSLHSLFRRFARHLEWPLLVMTVCSPAFLPGWNLMLDLPALALGLTALVVYLGSADRDSLARAAAAGLLAGLAMQTKYTAFLVPAVMLAHASLAGRVWGGVLGGARGRLGFAPRGGGVGPGPGRG